MIDVRAYEATAEPDAFTAVVGGVRLPVRRTRERAYPGLESPAPNTAGVYRVALHVMGRRKGVLDVGCGAGGGAKTLVGPGRGVTGLDPSAEAVAFAKAFAPTVRVLRGAAPDLDPGEVFDAATVVDVLGFVDDVDALLAAVRARLGPDGLLVVGEPRASLEQTLVPPVRRAYTAEALEAALVRGGFDPEVALASPAEFVMCTARASTSLRVADALAQSEAVGADPAAALEAVSAALDAVDQPLGARELLLAFGALHLRLGDLDSAAGTFVGALRLSPRSARGLVGLGRVAERLGRDGEALRLYEKATASDPHDPGAWTALGLLRARRADVAQATAALTRAARLAPTSDEVRAALATLTAAPS